MNILSDPSRNIFLKQLVHERNEQIQGRAQILFFVFDFPNRSLKEILIFKLILNTFILKEQFLNPVPIQCVPPYCAFCVSVDAGNAPSLIDSFKTRLTLAFGQENIFTSYPFTNCPCF